MVNANNPWVRGYPLVIQQNPFCLRIVSALMSPRGRNRIDLIKIVPDLLAWMNGSEALTQHRGLLNCPQLLKEGL